MEGFHYKDAPPSLTVARIRNILSDLGITLAEQWYAVAGTDLYSVRLADVRCPGVASAGKGVSRELALASAYGEFIERLQGGFLYFTTVDTVPLTTHGYDVGAREVVELSNHELMRSVGSNGCCAGNTPAEALSQGICEILERHVLEEIYLGGQGGHTIPLSWFAATRLGHDISELRRLGYSVTAKDCTLGGRFPVVGVVLVDRSGRVLNKFGADTSLETAVSRCLTEIFQLKNGVALESMSTAPRLVDSLFGAAGAEYDSCLNTKRRGEGVPPFLLLAGQPEADPSVLERVFLPGYRGNRKSLQHLVSVVQRQQTRLLVKDNSVLGFPAYHAYAGRLSVSRTKPTADRIDAIYRAIESLGPETTRESLVALLRDIEALGPRNLSLFVSYRGADTARLLRDSENPLVFKGYPALAVLHLALGSYRQGLEHLRLLRERAVGPAYEAFLAVVHAVAATRAHNPANEGLPPNFDTVLGSAARRYDGIASDLARGVSPLEVLRLVSDEQMAQLQYEGDEHHVRAVQRKLRASFEGSRVEQGRVAEVFAPDDN